MINLFMWYILPKSNIVSGNIKKEGISQFIQEKINSIEEVAEGYIVNGKYILEKDGMDSFFKEPQRLKIQLDFIKNFNK